MKLALFVVVISFIVVVQGNTVRPPFRAEVQREELWTALRQRLSQEYGQLKEKIQTTINKYPKIRTFAQKMKQKW